MAVVVDSADNYGYSLVMTQASDLRNTANRRRTMANQIADQINAGLEAKGYAKIRGKAWSKETDNGKLERVYLNRSNGKSAGFVAIKENGFELVSIDGAVLKSDLKSILGM